jgi:hypothetical protein
MITIVRIAMIILFVCILCAAMILCYLPPFIGRDHVGALGTI